MAQASGAIPRVSVVIPTYNNARYIWQAIDSVLGQTFQSFELIVVDDGSNDDTADCVARYGDPRVRYLYNDRQLGIAGARNRGVAAAHGEYTAALDSDDIAEPTRLARQVAFLDSHPDHAAVGSWARWIDSEGTSRPGVTRRPVDWQDAAAQLIYKSSLQQPSVTARTSVLAAHPYDERFVFSSDYELWSRLAVDYRLASQPLALVRCRRHAASTTRGESSAITACQHAIFAAQLERLGIDHNTADLERHRLLWRAAKRTTPLTRTDLDWAENWLIRLAEANERCGLYPNTAFQAVLGWGWCQIGYGILRHSPRYLPRWMSGWPRRYVANSLGRQFRRVPGHRQGLARLGSVRP